MLIGYGRVPTADQNPAHQIDALSRAGSEREHIDLDTASRAKARAATHARPRKGGRRPKLIPAQTRRSLYEDGKHTVADIAAMPGVLFMATWTRPRWVRARKRPGRVPSASVRRRHRARALCRTTT